MSAAAIPGHLLPTSGEPDLRNHSTLNGLRPYRIELGAESASALARLPPYLRAEIEERLRLLAKLATQFRTLESPDASAVRRPLPLRVESTLLRYEVDRAAHVLRVVELQKEECL